MARLVIVSNRVGLPGARTARAGGLAVAVLDALRHYKGLWFGWSGEIADESSGEPRMREAGKITYATVDLSKEDYGDYYVGYANGTLWPLLHFRLGLIEYKRHQFQGYLRVNAYLARMLLPLLLPDDVIWVHDYHLIPLGDELRKIGARNRLGFFLHTPFPPAEVLIALPHHDVMMQAFCAYDLIGFQTKTDVRAFLDYVVNVGGGHEDGGGRVSAFGRSPRIAAFPVGIDTQHIADLARQTARSPEAERLRESLGERSLIIGVDRLDYSKGIVTRFEAVDALLSDWPDRRGRFTYLQITPYSRSTVAQYRALRRELEGAAGRINGKFSEFDWTPIRYVNKSLSRQTLTGFYRLSRIGLVTPFRDGMNLVAKEYVASQDPQDPGVLVLSRFAGAAQELDAALQVNPFDVDEIAAALARGLAMPLAERRERWTAMMSALQRNTIATWREAFLAALRDSADAGAAVRPA